MLNDSQQIKFSNALFNFIKRFWLFIVIKKKLANAVFVFIFCFSSFLCSVSVNIHKLYRVPVSLWMHASCFESDDTEFLHDIVCRAHYLYVYYMVLLHDNLWIYFILCTIGVVTKNEICKQLIGHARRHIHTQILLIIQFCYCCCCYCCRDEWCFNHICFLTPSTTRLHKHIWSFSFFFLKL